MNKWRNNTKETILNYRSWVQMRHRCYNPKHKGYSYYGGRGIRVCSRWINDYDSFCDDMGYRKESESIDRIDPNGDYTPENCRWATVKEQARNKRNNIKILVKGELVNLIEVSENNGIHPSTILSRLRKGVDTETAISVKSMVSEARHGTISMYALKCRCDMCKEAHSSYMTAHYRNRKAELTAKGLYKQTRFPATHGTRSMYVNRGCRCDLCRGAQREHDAKRAERKKEQDRLRYARNRAKNLSLQYDL